MTAAAPATPATFAEAQDVLAARLPGYTRRPQQMALAEKIEQAIKAGSHGLLQASTGTGKSLALLIPGILSGQRVVVATSTKALQNQYATTDLPFLQEHLGVPFGWAVLKGRANYPCLAKASAIEAPSPVQAQVIERMKAASTPEEILDREDFPELNAEDWRPFSMTASECPGSKNCPFAKQCFAERAKGRAADASIVITNTALLMMDLLLRQQTNDAVAMLGEIDMIFVDEAHNLPDAATSALEDTMNQNALLRLARDMEAYLTETRGNEKSAAAITERTEEFWAGLDDRYASEIRRGHRDGNPLPLHQVVIVRELAPAITAIHRAINAAREEIKAYRADTDRQKIARSRLLTRSASWMMRLENFLTEPESKTVRWAERETTTFRGKSETRMVLRSAPISVGPFLRDAMWDKFPVLLSSATLTSGTRRDGSPDFDFIAYQLGLSLTQDEVVTFDAGTPFDYKRQSLLYTPGKEAPEPTGESARAWRVFAQSATAELVRKSGGGALLLFTSNLAMREAHQTLAPQFESMGLTVLSQGEAPAGTLVQRFKADGNAVLFGLKAFFEGVDIPTRALRLVVIDKLPFAVPTDLLWQARGEEINRRYNDTWASFNKMAVPNMILILTQAFGRLIRHADDIGVVAILDPRLVTKKYGSRIISALPPATLTHDIKTASAFLENLS